jgi:hypothetical protein
LIDLYTPFTHVLGRLLHSWLLLERSSSGAGSSGEGVVP